MTNEKNMLVHDGAAFNEHHCPLNFPQDKEIDELIVKKTVQYPTRVENGVVTVEVDIHMKYRRETLGYFLGDPAYSTTLLPGEKVRLASSDRRTQFSYDSESKLSYKSVQMSESQYYLSALRHFSAEGHSEQSGNSSSQNGWNFSGSASGGLDLIPPGGHAKTNASYNSHSLNEYLNSQSYHAQSSERQSVEATNKALSISIGEVATKSHSEGSTEEHYESSSRTFENKNMCHALTYIFYRLNKKQRTSFELTSIELRIADNAAPTGLVHLQPSQVNKVDIAPQEIPVSALRATKLQEAVLAGSARQAVANSNLNFMAVNPSAGVAFAPLQSAIREAAIKNVKEELVRTGVLDKNGKASETIKTTMSFQRESSIPTAGVVVKGYIDECDTCEPLLRERYELENVHLSLKNDLLKKQIELLEKSQEYRCCPVATPENN